ncbi:uncharacterized protein LOC123617857 [Camelus bactrianus]|uniref:Uncharacterized protein LOC123617857 n=1 Tax=Camelus bactrianus TaxID=9837 RepID=A0AC58RJP7_CAMBA
MGMSQYYQFFPELLCLQKHQWKHIYGCHTTGPAGMIPQTDVCVLGAVPCQCHPKCSICIWEIMLKPWWECLSDDSSFDIVLITQLQYLKRRQESWTRSWSRELSNFFKCTLTLHKFLPVSASRLQEELAILRGPRSLTSKLMTGRSSTVCPFRFCKLTRNLMSLGSSSISNLHSFPKKRPKTSSTEGGSPSITLIHPQNSAQFPWIHQPQQASWYPPTFHLESNRNTSGNISMDVIQQGLLE